MVEKLMQYVWQHRLWLNGDMRTVDGEPVVVLDPGLLNTDAGPDFFNAKIKIGDCEWAGNVEIHVRASDWKRHGHDSDPAYDSVMLHVVDTDDCRVYRPDGRAVPQLVLKCNRDFGQYYRAMVSDHSDLPCRSELAAMDSVYVADWITALGFERLYAKSEQVAALAAELGGDWRGAVYATFARALGFGLNSGPFERLAREVPLRSLLHHQNNLLSIEGALFGQAGLLQGAAEGSPEAAYIERLAAEHHFMSAKYGFVQPQFYGWKMARTRPHTFPQRRVALLAKMVSEGFGMATRITRVENLEQARELFAMEMTPFWQHHATFAPSTGNFGSALGKAAVDVLVINVVAPVLHAYGNAFGNDNMAGVAVELLESLAPENNSITRLFEQAGIGLRDAFGSQALVQLRRAYCEPRKCLYCRFGHRLMARSALRRDAQTMS